MPLRLLDESSGGRRTWASSVTQALQRRAAAALLRPTTHGLASCGRQARCMRSDGSRQVPYAGLIRPVNCLLRWQCPDALWVVRGGSASPQCGKPHPRPLQRCFPQAASSTLSFLLGVGSRGQTFSRQGRGNQADCKVMRIARRERPMADMKHAQAPVVVSARNLRAQKRKWDQDIHDMRICVQPVIQ